jgi:hypothetical protein
MCSAMFHCSYYFLWHYLNFKCFCCKVCWFEPYTIFSGGMPRASYGDRHCISVICGDSTQATFDFTSRVVDFFIIFDKHDKSKKVLRSYRPPQLWRSNIVELLWFVFELHAHVKISQLVNNMICNRLVASLSTSCNNAVILSSCYNLLTNCWIAER